MRPRDTTPEMAEMQFEMHQRMTGEQRVVLAFEMSLMGRELARAGIKHNHPDWTEAEIERELIRFTFSPSPLPPGF